MCVVGFLDDTEKAVLDTEPELRETVVGLCCPSGWLSVLCEGVVIGW